MLRRRGASDRFVGSRRFVFRFLALPEPVALALGFSESAASAR
jgi:hypothetical protein